MTSHLFVFVQPTFQNPKTTTTKLKHHVTWSSSGDEVRLVVVELCMFKLKASHVGLKVEVESKKNVKFLQNPNSKKVGKSLKYCRE